MRLFLIKHYAFNLKNKVQSSHYRYVSTDPLGTEHTLGTTAVDRLCVKWKAIRS